MPVPYATERRRVASLIRAIKRGGTLLPGDRLPLTTEKPATYLGTVETGDIRQEYIQLHLFRLHDGLQVILESPNLNRSLGRLVL